LELIIRKLRVQNLKAQIALRQYVCESLAREFHTPTLTTRERWVLARPWDIASKESSDFQRILDQIEREENEGLGDVSRETPETHLRPAN